MPVQRLVLDSHLLVLLVVGMASRHYIAKHKRLTQYTARDFDNLQLLAEAGAPLIVTPNTLTEASNLLGYIVEPARGAIYAMFRAVIAESEERVIASVHASSDTEFIRLGLTDVALLAGVRMTDVLLTDDLDLHVAALARGGASLRFRELIGS